MKFSVGDDVVILATGQEAEVLQILHPKILEVSCRGDVFPVFTKEVKLLSETLAATQEAKPKDGKKEQLAKKRELPLAPTRENGFYLSFEPVYAIDDPEKIQELKLSFINQTPLSAMLHYQCLIHNRVVAEQKAVVSPKTKIFFLHTLDFEAMNDLPRFYYSLKPVVEEIDWTEDSGFYFSDQLKLKPVKLFDYLATMSQKQAKTFEIKLGMPSVRPITQGEKTNVPHETFENKNIQRAAKSQSGKIKSVALREIDLHAEALGITTKGKDNFEILSRQLQALQKAIDAAVMNGRTSLIIIHGVGNGRLKEEVHLLLKGHPSVTFFQHSWRPKYGNGATEAFLK